MVPSSFADDAGYGVLTGKVIDRYGNPLGNATVDIRDWTGETVGTTISAGNGTFVLERIRITGVGGWDSFSLRATYSINNKTYSDKTEFFRIYKDQLTTHDAMIYYYPSSGYGWLTGKVVDKNNVNKYLSATIYLNNGMYYFVSGDPGDNWHFYLPEGEYFVWADHNENGKTYTSGKSMVDVKSDDTYTAVLTIPLTDNGTTYRAPPAPSTNIVHGIVTQKNNDPLFGATISLCKLTGRNFDPIMSTTTDASGKFEFRDVNISSPQENFVVKLDYDFMGSDYNKVSDSFTVYYNNMLNVPHDHNIPMSVDFVDSASLELISNPGGAHIWVDNMDTGRKTPFNFTGIKAGNHTVSLVLDGYMPANLTANVMPQDTTHINKQLMPSTGDVSFSVTPSDASIYVNGAFAGKGSVNMTKLQYGEYSYTVSRDGYNNVTDKFTVLPGGHLDITTDLVAVPGLSLTYIGYLISSIFNTLGNIF